MSKSYANSKDKDKKEKIKKETTKKVDTEDETTKKAKTEEKVTEKVKTEAKTTKKVDAEEEVTENVETEEETIETEEQTTEEDEYTDFNKAVEDTKNVAEKMFNDVVSSLKTRQEEWNKTLEEYKANKPPVDLLEYEDNLVVIIDTPRASKEDVSIMMSTDSIEVEIDFPETLEDEKECDCEDECDCEPKAVKVLRRERVSGKTKTIIPLPVEVDIKEVNAKFTDNELTITLPKLKGKKVDVEIV